MNAFCNDIHSFKHLHNLSVQKFRFNQALQNAIETVQLKLKQIPPPEPKEKVNLQSICLLMAPLFGKSNVDVMNFY